MRGEEQTTLLISTAPQTPNILPIQSSTVIIGSTRVLQPGCAAFKSPNRQPGGPISSLTLQALYWREAHPTKPDAREPYVRKYVTALQSQTLSNLSVHIPPDHDLSMYSHRGQWLYRNYHKTRTAQR